MTWYMAQHAGTDPNKWQKVWAQDLGHAAATVAVEVMKPKVENGERTYPITTYAYAAEVDDLNRHEKPPNPPICIHRFCLELTGPVKSPEQLIGSSP